MKYHSLYTLLVYWKPYNIRRLGYPCSVTLTKTWRRTFRIHSIKASRKETVYIDFILLDFRYPFHSKNIIPVFKWFFFLVDMLIFPFKGHKEPFYTRSFNSHWNNCSQTPTTLFTQLAKEDVSAVSLYVRELFLHHIFHVVASPSILI